MTPVSRVRTVSLPTYLDPRGSLTVAEGQLEIPFEISRIFYIYGVPPGHERGGHAHPYTEQFLICVAGGLTIDVSDPVATRIFELDDPGTGLYIPEMLWVRLYDFLPGAVCLAAASSRYSVADVIRDWDEYVEAARARFHLDGAASKANG